MKLTANITLDELTKSQVAERKGINNNPNPAQIENLKELAKWIRDNLEVDQGILEFYKDGEPASGWIHCSYSRNSNRQQWLRAMREDGKTVYKPWLGQ